MALKIAPYIQIDNDELDYTFVRASGPGGQHVNKASTAVQLRFDVAHSPSLPDDVRARLMRQESNRINQQGELIIHAQQYRSQRRNRRDATQRLARIIRRAAYPPKQRRKTKPPRAAKERRLRNKRRRSRTKKLRKPPREYS